MRFSEGRALETLVKQHAELFVKRVADKQHFPVFSDATVDIAMPSPCMYGVFPRNLGQGISVANSLGQRDPKRISRAE